MSVIGVTGASGQLGQLVLRALLKKGVAADHIVALARHTDKVDQLKLGVVVRPLDYDQTNTLSTALRGIDKLLLISSSEIGKRVAQHCAVINAAKQAGVKLIAYTSLLHADRSILVSLSKEHHASEQALEKAGVPYVVLRNGWYIENYFGLLPGALKSGTLLGASSNGKISAATRADFADAAAVVLTAAVAGVQGKHFELAGDHAFTLAELAAQLSAAKHKPVAYQNLSESEYAKALVDGAGYPQFFATFLAGCDAAAAQGALFDDSKQLSKLIGRPTTSLKDALDAASF